MSATGLDVFDSTIHLTNQWLKEIMEELGWRDRLIAYRALRATLHALRNRLTVDEVAQFSAQLPMLVRGFYYEGWDPSVKPLKERHSDHFLEWIKQEMRGNEPINPERVARAVFGVLERRITAGEIEDVKHMLPSHIRELWPAAEHAHVS